MPISCLGQRLQFSFSLFLNKKILFRSKRSFFCSLSTCLLLFLAARSPSSIFSSNSISLSVYLFIKPLCCCFVHRMGIAAFITEISTPEQRTFRLAMIHFVGSLGRPIGTKVWRSFCLLLLSDSDVLIYNRNIRKTFYDPFFRLAGCSGTLVKTLVCNTCSSLASDSRAKLSRSFSL